MPSRAIEREHVLGAEPLTSRMLGTEDLQLGDELGVASECELCLDPCLQGGKSQFLEPRGLDLEAVDSDDVGVRMTAPEGERGSQALCRDRHIPSLAGCGDRALEDDCVHRVGLDLESVPAALADDHVADDGAEVRDVRLQRRARTWRGLVTPDAVDERIDGDHASHVRRKKREHGPLLWPSERRRLSVLQNLERP